MHHHRDAGSVIPVSNLQHKQLLVCYSYTLLISWVFTCKSSYCFSAS